MQHAGSSPLTRDPTWPPHGEHAVLATGPQGSPTENGTLWGRPGYNQRPGRLPRPCSLSHIPQPACRQVPLLPPPDPLASAPSSPRPVVPFVQTQHFSGELGKSPTLTSLACSLSLSDYAKVILPNTKLAVKPPPQLVVSSLCSPGLSSVPPVWTPHGSLSTAGFFHPLHPVSCSSLAAGLLPLCSSGKLLFVLPGSDRHDLLLCEVFSVFPGRVGPFTCLSSSGHVLLVTLPCMSIIVNLPLHQPVSSKQRGQSLYFSHFSSVHFSRSVVSDSLRPHEPQHTRSPCPSPTPGVYPNPCPLSQ